MFSTHLHPSLSLSSGFALTKGRPLKGAKEWCIKYNVESSVNTAFDIIYLSTT